MLFEAILEFSRFLSLDTPESGSGDHENYYGIDLNNSTVYESNGTQYGDCYKRAVHIREIEVQRPWFAFGNNTLVFSDLSSQRFTHFTKENLKEALKNSTKTINYTKAVNSTYG